MSDATIEITGALELAERLGVDLTPAIQAASLAIAAEAQDRIAPYPAASGRRQAFTSMKQRRGFFARLHRGQIQVPYRRSNDVLQRWKPEAQGLGAVLRNTSPHAPLVHGHDTQAAYHKGTWKTDEGVAEEIENDGTAERIAEQAITKVLDADG